MFDLYSLVSFLQHRGHMIFVHQPIFIDCFYHANWANLLDTAMNLLAMIVVPVPSCCHRSSKLSSFYLVYFLSVLLCAVCSRSVDSFAPECQTPSCNVRQYLSALSASA